MLDVLDRLDEITHPGIARKQRSITRLFPEFPARVKSIGTKGGIRLLDMQPNYWHFSLHSGTKDNLWYDGHINFKDLVPFLDKHVGDKRLWTKNKEHVDLKKLAKKVMFYCQIQVKCSCPAFQYWGPAYIMSLSKYDGIFGDRENRPPRIRNPKQYGAICKHVQAMLNAYPFYMSTLAGFLRDTHTDQIRGLENKSKEQSDFFKGRGKDFAALLKAKQEEEPKEPDEDTPEVEYDAEEEQPRDVQPRDVRGRWSRKVRKEDEEQKESITIGDIDKPILREDMGDRLGKCYELSGRYVLDNHDAILVHGSINGRRMTGTDWDNPHAWVEEGDEVFDPVMDQRLPKEAYYGMMQAKVIKKYDWSEMAKTMMRAEHWGPWHSETNEAFEDTFQPVPKEKVE